jgi:hypothetical protein
MTVGLLFSPDDGIGVRTAVNLSTFQGTFPCVLNNPIPKELAENSQIFAEICSLGWVNGGSIIPCPAPAEPTIITNSERPQSVVIRTSFGAWNFYAIRVQALDSSFNEIWQRRSIQGRPTAGYWTSGSEVDLGVPGLNAGATNYIRVAMEDSAGHLTCWSNYKSVVTPSFAKTGPPLPANINLKVQDDYDRPATAPLFPVSGAKGGDGIGPTTVWTTSDSLSTSKPVVIASDGMGAKTSASSFITYNRTEENNAHTYVEAELRVDRNASPDSSKYNFQVQVRIGEPDLNTGVPSYAARLVKGHRGCSSAAILLFRTPDESIYATCVGSGSNLAPNPNIGGAICTSDPPLATEDSNKPGFSLPVWMRLEVNNTGEDEAPVLTAQAFWVSGSSFQQCKATAVVREDTGDPGQMKAERGKWGLSTDDGTVFWIGGFWAGDQSQ